MVTVLLVLASILAMAALLRAIWRTRRAASAALDFTAPTEAELTNVIREEIAPQSRPYGSGGKYIDSGGKRYLADKHGTLHRIVITEDGIPLAVKPWSKARRKAEKRKLTAIRQRAKEMNQ